MNLQAADCLNEEPFGEVRDFIRNTEAVVREESEIRQLYDELKKDFLSAGFCDPLKVYNDVNQKPHPMLLSLMGSELLKLARARSWSELSQLTTKLGLDPELSTAAIERLKTTFTTQVEESYPSQSPQRLANKKKKEMAYLLLFQALNKKLQTDPAFGSEKLLPELKRLKHLPPDGECRFVNYDAFSKALRGQAEILKNPALGVKNKNTLTIVDYTIPMNQRRMFVLDLKNKMVLHNTYTAQGGGNTNGMSPEEFSNESGSDRSSDGFIVADKPIASPTWGPAVYLRGIDRNNNKMAARHVILHAVSTPYRNYLNGDVFEKVLKVKSEDDLDQYAISETTRNGTYTTSLYAQFERALLGATSVAATSGCLGVPDTDMRHLDRKTRTAAQQQALAQAHGSQTELLRQDLPGSVIFSYSGEDMKSKYFKD